MTQVITGQSEEMNEAARMAEYMRRLALVEKQMEPDMTEVRSATIFNEQTERLESHPDAPPFIQAQNAEALLEMELMGSFDGGDWFGRMRTLFDDPNSDRNSFDAVCDSFDRVRWRQYLKTALQETKRTDGLNFRRIRMLQNILSRA